MLLTADRTLQPSSDFVFDHMNGTTLSVTNLSHSISFYTVFKLLFVVAAGFKNDNVLNPTPYSFINCQVFLENC